MSSPVAALYERRPFHDIVRLFSTVIDRRYSRILVITATLLLTACSSAVTPGKISQIHASMKSDEVKALLGPPAHIDQSETTGLHGEAYHYPTPNGEGRVIFLNDIVFKAEFIPGAKS